MSGIAGISDGPAGPQTGKAKLPGLADIKWGAKGEARIESSPERPEGEPPTFVVFKTETCTFCAQTMQFLQALHEERGDFRVATVDAQEQRGEFQKVSQHTRRTTVPQIFLDGRFLGGWDDLARAAKAGRLDAYLDGADWKVAAAPAAAPWWKFWQRRASQGDGAAASQD